MMRVFLLRHGTAEPRGDRGDDRSDRQLVDKGRGQCRVIASLLVGMQVRFDRVLSSPYDRARQTAEAVLQGMEAGCEAEVDERLAPDAPLSRSLALIAAQQARCLLVVGHEPALSQITASALGCDDAEIVLRKGGLVELALLSRRPLRAQLRGLIRPRHLLGGASLV